MPGKMTSKLFIFSILFLFFTNQIVKSIAKNQVSPFSQINITSQKAICQKDPRTTSCFFFKYLENVVVTLADESKIQSEEVELELNAASAKKFMSNTNTSTNNNFKQKDDSYSVVKKITFKNNVKFVNQNKKIDADQAEIYLPQKECILTGSVQIEQEKKSSKDIPITTKCEKAFFNFETEKIMLEGNTKIPVLTTIKIEQKPSPVKNKKNVR